MRFGQWLLVLLTLALIVGAMPVRAEERPNNILVVDEDAAPPALLTDEEVERIARLQEETVNPLPYSPVSPDDQVIFVTTDQQIGFLNLQNGRTQAIDPESFGPLVPLPLLGFSRFAWLDNTTLGALALDFSADRLEEAFVALSIDRTSLRVRGERLRFPSDTGIVSVSPDLQRFLLVQLPQEAQGREQMRALRVRISRTTPGLERAARIPMPLALQRRVDEARSRQAVALERLWLMQNSRNDEMVAVAPRSLDLVLYTRGQPGVRYVTTIPEASVPFGDAWARDSSRLAVSFAGLADPEAVRPGLDGALLSDEIYRDTTGNMPPSINPLLQNNNTYVIDAVGGTVRVLRPGGSDAPPLLAAHAWAPDNKGLLVEAWHPARLRSRTFPIYTPQFSERSSFRFYDENLREVGRLESDLFGGAAFASVVADFVGPDELIFRTIKGTDRPPYYYNRVSGELRSLADRAGSYYNVFSTNTSRQIVFMFNSFSEPPDIYRVGWDGRGFTRLTWFNEELRQFAGLRQDPVSFRLKNGQTRVGVLIQPAGAPFPPRNVPIVVWQEGGPGVPLVNRWYTNVENATSLLPAMGFAVLVTPLAGRPGYSPAVFNSLADGANFGQIDIDEQAEIVQQLIARGWTSRGHVGITGCSYGGYFALQSVVRHPDLYAAANVQCSLVDLTTEWTRGFDALMPYLMGLPPYNNPDEYRRDSPVYNTAQIKAAVLTFHGTDDYLPIVQNENLHLQLVNRGVPARLVKFSGEGHGLSEQANQLYAAQEQVAWFRAYLR